MDNGQSGGIVPSGVISFFVSFFSNQPLTRAYALIFADGPLYNDRVARAAFPSTLADNGLLPFCYQLRPFGGGLVPV